MSDIFILTWIQYKEKSTPSTHSIKNMSKKKKKNCPINCLIKITKKYHHHKYNHKKSDHKNVITKM